MVNWIQTKGTWSKGKHNRKSHTLCVRCGRRSLHCKKKSCASCGFPEKKIRKCMASSTYHHFFFFFVFVGFFCIHSFVDWCLVLFKRPCTMVFFLHLLGKAKHNVLLIWRFDNIHKISRLANVYIHLKLVLVNWHHI